MNCASTAGTSALSQHRQSFRYQRNFCHALMAQARTAAKPQPFVKLQDILPRHIGPQRPLLIAEPHSDDLAICCGALAFDFSQLGIPVEQTLFFSGWRSAGFPDEMPPAKRTRIRVKEGYKASKVLGTRYKYLKLKAYDEPEYNPTDCDLEKIIQFFAQKKPGAVLVPPANDGHAAHRATRALVAFALFANDLRVPIFTYGSCWGVVNANAYHSFDRGTFFKKLEAVCCYRSQLLNGDYVAFAEHSMKASAPLIPQLAGSHHSLNGDVPFACEMYRIERLNLPLHGDDPIQTVLGIWSGHLEEVAPSQTNYTIDDIDMNAESSNDEMETQLLSSV